MQHKKTLSKRKKKQKSMKLSFQLKAIYPEKTYYLWGESENEGNGPRDGDEERNPAHHFRVLRLKRVKDPVQSV